MSRRRDELFAAADEFNRIHNAWASDPNRPNPDNTYWDAVDALLKTFDGDIPGDCRELSATVEELRAELEFYDSITCETSAMPRDAFWNARSRIENARKVRKNLVRKPLESVKQLHAEGISNEQIARMWKLVGPNGQPAYWLVQKELDEPGSVITPEKIKEIEEADGLAEVAEQEEIEQQHAESMDRKRRRAVEESKPCPETPEELWMQGVGVQQSAKMLKKSEVDVAAMFQQFDKDREAKKTRAAADAALKAVHGQPSATTELGATGDDESTDAKIESMIKQDFTKEQIVEALKVDGRTVAAALRRLKPQTAGA